MANRFSSACSSCSRRAGSSIFIFPGVTLTCKDWKGPKDYDKKQSKRKQWRRNGFKKLLLCPVIFAFPSSEDSFLLPLHHHPLHCHRLPPHLPHLLLPPPPLPDPGLKFRQNVTEFRNLPLTTETTSVRTTVVLHKTLILHNPWWVKRSGHSWCVICGHTPFGPLCRGHDGQNIHLSTLMWCINMRVLEWIRSAAFYQVVLLVVKPTSLISLGAHSLPLSPQQRETGGGAEWLPRNSLRQAGGF